MTQSSSTQSLLGDWASQLADPMVLAILRSALEGGAKGEVRLYFTSKGAVRRPMVVVSPSVESGA